MTTLREAAQMALDALDSDNPDIQLRAATHLRAALAQPEPEPVAEVRLNKTGGNAGLSTHIAQLAEGYFKAGTKLYTAPPQRKWVGLTDEERQECLYSDPIFGMAASTFARAIEAKLREKNSAN